MQFPIFKTTCIMKNYFLLTVSFLCLRITHAQNLGQQLDSVINVYYQQGRFNGSVLVAKKNVVLLEKGYGIKDASKQTMNNANTLYQAGSVTKQFTAAIILKLQQMKKLSVNDKLNKYFTELKWADSVTIENLVTHTAGIFNYTNNTGFMLNKATLPATQKDILALFKDKPLEFAPGTKYSYSNSGYMLLGYIIEKVTRKPYTQVVREYIFTPARMVHTGFDFKNKRDNNKATGYNALSKKETLPAGIVDSTVSFAAGAIFSTIGDLYLWDQLLYTNTLLSKTSLAHAFTPYKTFGYGYGWLIDSVAGRKIVQHSGGIFGFSSFILRNITDSSVVILLDNKSSAGLAEMAANLNAVVNNIPFAPATQKNEIILPDSVLQQYAGEYELAANFIIKITVENGTLKAQATNQPMFELFATRQDYFFLKAVRAEVEFLRDTNSKVEKLVLHQGGRDTPGKKIK
jgi:CubicO group peptidase (beta-lactamase class C family)